MPPRVPANQVESLRQLIARTWGFPDFRPLQREAMEAVLARQDSLVVLPTGGGKSLCYSAALHLGGVTVVVSPLIALMKDQVDGLTTHGVPAVQLNSSQTPSQRADSEARLRRGEVRLLFASPERLVLSDFQALLRATGVHTFAIDEAHCISHWGHDFRPEYRQLARLREQFPQASVHAYTATATEQVRADIIHQLELRDPTVLVGNFDRPNLTYRVLPRHDLLAQALEVLERHPGQGGIVYCLSKRDVDELAARLRQRDVKALPYHAGLPPEQRKVTQDAFINEDCDVVVATIAFGMGIDRSNVRFVIHAALPKSLEHYQQETGRAGRDGLPADCVLLYSGADSIKLRSMLQRSAEEAQADPAFLAGSLRHLDDMDRYARGAVCRHKALVNYFGQEYPDASCAACDLCLGDTALVPDAATVAKKILSAVARVKEGFGIGHVLAVLKGKHNEQIARRGHDKLSVFGILREGATDADLRDWIYQLIGQEALAQQGDEYPILKLTPGSWEVMRGQREVRLVQLVRRKKRDRRARAEPATPATAFDAGLFEAMRALRKEIAGERQIPPFQVFGDRTLEEMARRRPSNLANLRGISGVGDMKLRDFGPRFLALITDHSRRHGLPLDQGPTAENLFAAPEEASAPTPRQETYFALFREGMGLDEVATRMNCKRLTASEHLAAYVRTERPRSVAPWVSPEVYERVAEAARAVESPYLKPIFQELGESVDYDTIRVVVAHLQANRGEPD